MPHRLTTRLLLVRHAESLSNAAERLQGSGDDPLTSRGEEQAHQLGAWLQTNGSRIHALFSSPLRRAQRTADIIGAVLGLPVQTRPGLREIGIGTLEGTDMATWRATIKSGTYTPCQGGEAPYDFVERALGTLHGLLAANEDRTILVITHGAVISAALAYWVDRNTLHWSHYATTQNTAVSELLFGERVELVRYNDTSHLAEELVF
ncbi:MAG: histidine phosphatase family protein [Chloroflexaceae bacterium]